MQAHEEKLIKLEIKVEGHEERLDGLESRVGVLHKDLNKLIALTSNIKWWVIGVGSVYIVEQIGLMPFIKKLVGV